MFRNNSLALNPRIIYNNSVMNDEKQCCSRDRIERTAEKLKVLGHPLRLEILCLIEKNSSCVSELWQCLDQPQPVISQHLAILKNRGIVESQTNGNKRIYSIVDPFVKEIIAVGLKNEPENPSLPH
ncbi:MAG: winged helix-turn-helix transcriptional regulator [Spirochaetales bacterium]|nr:winged helix-turn-helix transcriptional regulator [Spirochaetales bacterium]